MRSLARFAADLLDALLGARCRLGCGTRVFPRDVGWHEDLDHAGDAEVSR